MRENKFRGKVLYNGNHYFSGDWVKGFYLENRKGEAFIIDIDPDEFGNASFSKVQVDPDTVGQYIGLKDCKRTEKFPEGQEIYEDDILKTECDEIKYYSKTDITKHIKTTGDVVCKWEGYGFYFSHIKKNQHGINLTNIEIIGNIHEGPECTPED